MFGFKTRRSAQAQVVTHPLMLSEDRFNRLADALEMLGVLDSADRDVLDQTVNTPSQYIGTMAVWESPVAGVRLYFHRAGDVVVTATAQTMNTGVRRYATDRMVAELNSRIDGIFR